MTRETSRGTACAWTVRATPIGPLLLAATGEGLVSVALHAGEHRTRQTLDRLAAALGSRPVPAGGLSGTLWGDTAEDGAGHTAAEAPATALAAAAAEIDRYFRGELREFAVPLDWSLVSGFTEQVLRELAARVPFGTVVGYGELAERVGEPGAARAVGFAMGANPLPLVVPCHRVVAADGGLGGFGSGLETKRALLAVEGVLPQPLF